MKLFGISLESWLPWKMASRIRILSFVLDRIGRSDFSQMAPMAQSDIIGDLGRKINELASSLSSQIKNLKHERAQLEAIINNMAEGVVVTDENGTITLANKAWYNIFSSSPDKLGRSILESVRVPQIFDGIKKSMLSGKHNEVEFGLGDRFFVSKSTPFVSSEFNGCVTVVNDISRMKELENMRRDFTANVSHQMKTPLTSILGYSETLLQGAINDPEASMRFVQTIHEQAISLKELIEDVLGLARIESSTYQSEWKEMNLQNAVASAVAGFKDTNKHLSISIDVPKITIRSDQKAIEHILHNLIDNAVKYTPADGSVKIVASENGTNMLISVIDNGVGIPEGDINRIFERFYRASGPDNLPREGTGLGLAIAKHLVEKLRGQISVKSRVGEGSTFTINIPKV